MIQNVRLSVDMLKAEPLTNTLIAEANHRIANNLAVVSALLRRQAADLAKQSRPISAADARAILVQTAGRIETVSRLHRMLSETDAHAIDVGLYIREVVASTVSAQAGPGAAATAFAVVEGLHLDARLVLPLGLVVGEIVSNALKYSHPTGLPTALSVRCSRTADKTIIEIADDGVGLPEGLDPMTDGNLGLKLIRLLSQQMGANVAFSSGPLGLLVQIAIPN